MKDFVELLKKRQSFVEMERKQISPLTLATYVSSRLRQIQIFISQVCQFFPKSHLDFLWFRYIFCNCIENHVLEKWLMLLYMTAMV